MTTEHSLPAKVGINFADKRRSLGRYASLADYGHGVCIYIYIYIYGLYENVIGIQPFTAQEELCVASQLPALTPTRRT
jgi:hypothetical protein